MLTQVLPYPPDSGPKIKTYNVIKYLSRRYRVTLASFVRGDQSEHARALERYCEAVYTVPMERGATRDIRYMGLSLLVGQPFMMIRDDRRAMRALVDRLSADHHFDVVHADQLNMAQYAERVPDAFKVLDAHNALWVLYKRLWETMAPGPRKWLLGRDWRLLKSYEGRVVREFDAVLAVSYEDKTALQEAAAAARATPSIALQTEGRPAPSAEIRVIPIAIDTDEVTVVERVEDPRHILHIGTMYWPPNIDAVKWFVDQIYPLIRQSRADVQFDVVGARPPADLMALNDAQVGINVTGYVEDPAPYQRRAAVMIVPLLAGGGMRVKILNALAEGIPIVSTTLGCEGIHVTDGENILTADEPGDFATAVLRVLNDRRLARRLARNGRRLAETEYDYRRACVPLDQVYRRGDPSGCVQHSRPKGDV
jgi:glycosyltransferase involved in cell wall biosynthesis